MSAPRTLGPYEIVRRLGGGGMGETFLAVKRGPAGFEQRVCLKRVLPEHEGDEQFVRFFLDEARIAATLRHSNIVGVVDFGAADGVYFMALELVDGTDLGHILRRSADRRLPAPLVALLGADLAHGLEYAHGRTRAGEASGILHRDLSASNVLVSYAGEVKLSDFGLAKVMSAGDATASGAVRGKVPYMSPEQASAGRMDARSDLFSLGIVLHEALTGARPFDGATFGETMARILNGVRAPLAELAPDAPSGLVTIIDGLLEVDPERRPASAAALLDELAPQTPPPSARRALGAAALRARPKQTLGLLPVDDAAPAQGPAAATQKDSPESTSPRVAAARGAAFGLLVVALVGIAVVAVRQAFAPTQDPPPPEAAQPLRPTAPVSAPAAPDPAPIAAPVATSPAPTVAPPPPSPSATASPPAPPTPPAPVAPPAAPAATAPTRATLTVAAIPWGKVWIDGRLVGNAPAHATLAPGSHSIAAGSGGAPTARTTVRLAPGERRSVTLRLR